MPAATGSLTEEALLWPYSYFSGHQQAKGPAEMCPKWTWVGTTPKWATGCPLPTSCSCHLSHAGTSVTLGAWWFSWEGWISPGWGGGSNSPPLGTAGYPICLTQLRGSSPASATLMLQCTNTLAVLSSLLHFKCTHISTNSLESAH